jgi:hypothetical protein
MSELELRQIFKNQSDCYADTRKWDTDGIETEGPVIQAMTEDMFIKVLMNANMIKTPSESPIVCFRVNCSYCCNDECHIYDGYNQSMINMMDECIYRITEK